MGIKAIAVKLNDEGIVAKTKMITVSTPIAPNLISIFLRLFFSALTASGSFTGSAASSLASPPLRIKSLISFSLTVLTSLFSARKKGIILPWAYFYIF